MRAVILAAGRGTRIHSITAGAPKCLLFARASVFPEIASLFVPAGIIEG